jgi:hypothetical protein
MRLRMANQWIDGACMEPGIRRLLYDYERKNFHHKGAQSITREKKRKKYCFQGSSRILDVNRTIAVNARDRPSDWQANPQGATQSLHFFVDKRSGRGKMGIIPILIRS